MVHRHERVHNSTSNKFLLALAKRHLNAALTTLLRQSNNVPKRLMPKDTVPSRKKKKVRATDAPIPLFDSSTREFHSIRTPAPAAITASNVTSRRYAIRSQLIPSLPKPILGEFDETMYAKPTELDDVDDSCAAGHAMDVDPNSASPTDVIQSGLPNITIVKTVSKRYVNSDIPLATWAPFRDEYLDELMGLEGRGRFGSTCSGCGKWNTRFFERTSLRELGLRVQLGHASGRWCCSFKAGNKDFVVIHTNGIHTIHLEFCRCNGVPRHTQLLRTGWYPATPLKPQTCVTMEVLRLFHTLHLQGKTTGFSFYKSLEYLTDNTGLYPPPDRLDVFMLAVREWRHLKLLKRAGRTYDPLGVINTPPGSLAIICRACPQPGLNLPLDWDTRDTSKRWLYMLTLAMDANFRLRSKIRGTQSDPHLSPGWAYFVAPAPYGAFVAGYADDDDISSCVGFQALLNMLTKKSKGLRATGMAAVSCARHQMFRPLGMGDLQKGERQCNMDYIFASSVIGVGLRMVTISYNVGYGEGVERNWDELNGQAPSTAEMLPGHRWETLDDCCSWANWRKSMGLGKLLLKHLLLAIPEAIRTANDFNRFDSRLREQNPGEVAIMERELVEWEVDHSKPDPYQVPRSTVTMDQVRYVMAAEEKERAEVGTTFIHAVSTSAFLLLGIEIENLQQALRTEVNGRRQQTLLQTTSVTERRTTLLKRVQRFRELQRLYMVGFDPVLYAREKEDKRVENTSEEPSPPPERVEDFPLFMPSGLSTAQDIRKFCPNGLSDLEDRLRFAEASDTLERLKHHLRTRSFANIFKVANVTGQIRNTRAREQQSRIDDKVRAAALRYWCARTALKRLRGSGGWELYLQVLNNTDIRALNERELTRQEQDAEAALHAANGVVTQLDLERAAEARRTQKVVSVGEGHRAPSWIWFTNVGVEKITDPLTRKALRVEWAKSGSRAARWLEEVIKLEEEMRRVLESSVVLQDHWKAEILRRPLPDDKDRILKEGLQAYAAERIDREQTIHRLWTEKWTTVRLLASPIVAGNIPDDSDPAAFAKAFAEAEVEVDMLDDGDDTADFEMDTAQAVQ
ncbi:hypothetical protein HWV62_44514 [Athelia sp. TMB]|nr:hypothetical protein HWV62_44514 [Athelia sp. TMB]